VLHLSIILLDKLYQFDILIAEKFHVIENRGEASEYFYRDISRNIHYFTNIVTVWRNRINTNFFNEFT